MDTSGADDVCPVCKSSRYMNPKMKFLVNPECYHRMCSSCVDRIFAAGRAKCPIAKCSKSLRKGGFRAQMFDDVKMEQERDVREEVAQVFNRRQEDFEDLKAYNDYLEEKEDICFGLVNEVDVEDNRKRLNKYREANKASIKANLDAEKDAEEEFRAQEAQEREMLKLRREAARREEEEERRLIEEERRRVVDDIASGRGDPKEIERQSEERIRRHRIQRSKLDTTQAPQQFAIRGLKKPSRPEPPKSYDPFGDLRFESQYYNPILPHTTTDAIHEARSNNLVKAGGYDVDGYCQHLLSSAFAGLGVFVGTEMTGVEAT